MQLPNEDFVNQTYTILLGRQADSEGFSYYLKRLQSGELRSGVLEQISSSDEAARYSYSLPGVPEFIRIKKTTGGNANNISSLLYYDGAIFIEQTFNLLLKRNFDVEGMQYYMNRLALGHSKQSVLFQISTVAIKNGAQIDGLVEFRKDFERKNHWFFSIFTKPLSFERQLNRIEDKLSKISELNLIEKTDLTREEVESPQTNRNETKLLPIEPNLTLYNTRNLTTSAQRIYKKLLQAKTK